MTYKTSKLIGSAEARDLLTDIDLQALRLSSRAVLSARDGQLQLENGETGQTLIMYEDSLFFANLLLDWTSPSALFDETHYEAWTDKGFDRDDYNESAADTLESLIDLGVIETRAQDLTGDRLSAPEGAWDRAMDFILSTRTARRTQYVKPDDYYAQLALKAVVEHQPSAFYERPDTAFIPLPSLSDAPGLSKPLNDALLERRTSRRYADEALPLSDLADMLYLSWGMTGITRNPLGDVFVRKTSPSGGSLHSIEVYPVVLNVEGLEPGCYHYSVRRHGLETIRLESPLPWIVEAIGDQPWVAEAGVIFVVTSFLPRVAWKYNFSRVMRAILSEVGYTGQTAFLVGTAMGNGVFTSAALRDQIFEEKLGLDPLREPVFSVTGMGRLSRDYEDSSRPRYEDAEVETLTDAD